MQRIVGTGYLAAGRVGLGLCFVEAPMTWFKNRVFFNHPWVHTSPQSNTENKSLLIKTN
jgi:hypothetical protein